MTAGPGIVPPPEDMDLPGFACLLRDAARASSRSWTGTMNQQDRNRAVRHLARAVTDLRTVTTRLAARFRLQAVSTQEPAGFARAAAASSAAQAVGQACLIINDVMPAVPPRPGHASCVPSDLLCYAAMRCAAWRKPVAGLEQVTRPLAQALTALADGTAELAAGSAQPQAACLICVRACLHAAAGHLAGSPRAGRARGASVPGPEPPSCRRRPTARVHRGCPALRRRGRSW